MKRRGLIRLIDDVNGSDSASRIQPAARANALGSGGTTARLKPPRYVQPPSRFEARHFDHGEPVSLSVTAFGAAPFRPFATRADYELARAHSMPRAPESREPASTSRASTSRASTAGAPMHSEPFYVEPFEESTEETGGSGAPRYDHVEVGGKPGRTPATDHGSVEERTRSEADEREQAENERFEADVRRILEEKARYDDARGQAPSADAPRASTPAAPPAENERPRDEHAIFERIAQSMKLANAYDLGSVALSQKFDAFDRDIDARASSSRDQARRSSPPQKTTEFLEDMDDIRRTGAKPEADGEQAAERAGDQAEHTEPKAREQQEAVEE